MTCTCEFYTRAYYVWNKSFDKIVWNGYNNVVSLHKIDIYYKKRQMWMILAFLYCFFSPAHFHYNLRDMSDLWATHCIHL